MNESKFYRAKEPMINMDTKTPINITQALIILRITEKTFTNHNLLSQSPIILLESTHNNCFNLIKPFRIENFKNEEREHISGDPIENSRHKLYSNRHPPQNDDGFYTQRTEIRRPLEPQEYPRSQSPMNTSGCNPLAYEKEKMTPQERKPTVHSKGMDPFNRPRTAQIKVEERFVYSYRYLL